MTRSTRSRTTSSGELAVVRRRLGAVLVGVAEHADHVEPRLGEEPLQLRQVVLGLAGEADDDVGPQPGRPGLRRGPSRPARGTGRCRRTGASGAAPWRCCAGTTGRSTAPRPASTSWPPPARAASRPAAGSSPGPGRRPSTAASSGSSVSSSRRSPRSLPYDVEFSLTRTSSRTPWSASQPASASSSGGRRDTNAPRNAGIAQNVQRRSQPQASLSGAGRTVAEPHPQRTRPGGRREPLGQVRPGEVGGHEGRPGGDPVRRGQREQLPTVPRHVRHVRLAGEDRLQPAGDVGVVVEGQHRVGLRQRRRQLVAVALGEAADGHDGLGAAARRLEVRGGEQRVDRVLLGGVDEAARVDHRDVGVGRLGAPAPSRRRPAARPAPRSRPRCGRSRA